MPISQMLFLAAPLFIRGLSSDLSAIAQSAAAETRLGGSVEARGNSLTLPPFVAAQLDTPMNMGVASNVA